MRRVRYTPPLMDQIQKRHALPKGRIVIVKTPTGYVPAVDPKTQTALATPQQFQSGTNGALKALPSWQWIDSPDVIEVGSISYS
jgi:hypothetical protein